MLRFLKAWKSWKQLNDREIVFKSGVNAPLFLRFYALNQISSFFDVIHRNIRLGVDNQNAGAIIHFSMYFYMNFCR